MGEEKRMDTFESLARNHVELQVKPCASGVLCSALMYNADGSIVILAKEGLAFRLSDGNGRMEAAQQTRTLG